LFVAAFCISLQCCGTLEVITYGVQQKVHTLKKIKQVSLYRILKLKH